MRMALVGGAFVYTTAKHTAMTTAIQTWFTNTQSCVSSLAKLSFVKFNPIDVTGHYAISTTNQQVLADIAGGITETTPARPNQVAWAISLTTAYSRGPAHKGRFYSPMPTCPLAAGGVITASYVTNAKTQATTLLNALNAVDSAVQVAVFSRKQGAPAHNIVTGISLGQVLDTQRRRRRQLLEAWV